MSRRVNVIRWLQIREPIKAEVEIESWDGRRRDESDERVQLEGCDDYQRVERHGGGWVLGGKMKGLPLINCHLSLQGPD